MLRKLVLLLLISNLLFLGWTRGWLDSLVGIKAGGDREPERMALQFNPERIKLLTPQAAAALQPKVCLMLGPLDGDAALQAAQGALERNGVPASAWQTSLSEQPGVWAVLTIRMLSKDFQARKEETYRRLNIAYETLPGPAGELPTLLLSRHASEKAAEAALENLSRRALKGLRVQQLQAPQRRHTLLFNPADGLLQAQLRQITDPALAGGFKPCPAAVQASAGAAPGSASAASR